MNVVVERFLSINRARLERTLEIMPARHRPYIQVMPLLFHLNDPMFPAYQKTGVPIGVYGYSLDAETQNAVQKLWRGFRYRPKPFISFDIEAIFLMGSCGSVAFNAASDFDVWICYRPGLAKGQLRALQQKARLLEQWYEEQGLEVHFFLMNPEAFRQGKVVRLSSESSGSAQYHLLLDEFYRSSVWLAGKRPLWWEISFEEEKRYEKSKAELIEKGLLDERECIDFGGLPAIPKSEFFGAAVWQIYKGIDSPYKSVLKITLMEAYAQSYPKIIPLSSFFKKCVYEGESDPLALDAYIMMFNRIDNYLRRKSELSRLEVARRSFYLKLSLPLSLSKEENNWRRQWIENLVYKEWNWSKEKIQHLDSAKYWKIEDVKEERKLLVSHLTNSYGFLSKFARKHASRRLIKPKDLTILGRKLYSAFDRKAGKVEIFNRGIAENMAEKSITVRLFITKDSREYWHIYRGKVISDQYKNQKPLKHSFSLIELLAWAHGNKLIADTTQKLMYAPGSDLGNAELNTLLSIVSDLVGKGVSLTPRSKDLLKAATIEGGAVFVNLGRQPKHKGPKLDNKLISGELDVFSYADNYCAVESIEYLYVTSWKELFAIKYSRADGMANWLCSVLNMYKSMLGQSGNEIKIATDVYSFGASISHVIATRINDLFKSVVKHLLGSMDRQLVYLYQAAGNYYYLYFDGDHFDFEKFSSIDKLMDHLAMPRELFIQLIFDHHFQSSSPLPVIYETNAPGKIQIFVQEDMEDTKVYILDENGALYRQTLPVDKATNVLSHFADFFHAVLDRRGIDKLGEVESELVIEPDDKVLEAYQLLGSGSHFLVEPVSIPESTSTKKLEIQVVGQQIDNRPVFSFFCDDIEFSSSEHGGEVFEAVATYIQENRSGEQDYYMYITDMELSPALLGKKMSQRVQTMELLNYKKRIEKKLNRLARASR